MTAARANLVHEFLATTARGAGRECAALIAGDETIPFARLDRDSDALAAVLQDRGVRRGDRVALILENTIALVTGLFATLKAGGVMVPVNPTVKPDKLTRIIEDCEPAAVIAHRTTATALAGARPGGAPLAPEAHLWDSSPGDGPGTTLAQVRSGPDRAPRDPGLIDHDLAAILYTSGSSGEAKGVMLTHRNLTNTTRAIAAYLDNVPEDVVLCVLPLSFGYGLCQVLTGAFSGFSVVLERSFAYPAQVLAQMARHRVTGLPGVPTMYARLLALAGFNAEALPALRFMTNAAAALPPPHALRLQDLFPRARIFAMYGQTECTRTCFLDPARLRDKPDSVGRAIPNCETYIVDEAGRRLGPGVVGELVVRGANVMRGYWRRPQETAARLRDGDIPGESVLHTGDRFRTDEEGLLYFVGRGDDIFKCHGEKVSPTEIEHVLYELGGVAEAAVFGVDDPIDGKAIKALIVPREGSPLTEAQVRQHCRARLELRLVPKLIEFRASLPKTESGKIRRSALGEPPRTGGQLIDAPGGARMPGVE